jgi:hypothetical protein
MGFRMPGKDPALKEKKKMLTIVKDLQKRMKELESLKKNIDSSKIKLSSARKSRELLEEIKVPPLEILKETSEKK